MTISKEPSGGVLGTSPKSSSNTFSLYAESSSTRRGSVQSVNDSPSLQRRLIDATLSQASDVSRNFVPPRM